ncbi:MAG: NAD-dependent deacylase [Halioglobus sp.]
MLKPLNESGRVVVLTGAGISAESGLATFRDSDGLWEKHDPMEIATPQAFARDPELVYGFYNARRKQLLQAQPNSAHAALAELETALTDRLFLVTQNVDDLHERGGSSNVCHMHGELGSMLCMRCDNRLPATEAFDATTHCPLCGEGGGLRPDIVWFGEMPYHMEAIATQIQMCDLFVAIGTSGSVYPAAGFVREARLAGAHCVEVNLQSSDVAGHFHEHFTGLATDQVRRLVDELLSASV